MKFAHLSRADMWRASIESEPELTWAEDEDEDEEEQQSCKE